MAFARVLLLAALLLTSCADREPHKEVPSELIARIWADTLAFYDLSGRIVTNSDSLARAQFVAVGDSRIYVGDIRASHELHVFDRNTGALVNSGGRRRHEPRQISNLWSMYFKPGRESGWLYEASARAMRFFNGDSLIVQTAELKGDVTPMAPVWIVGDSIASAGIYPYGRLALYCSDGEFSRMIGPDPPGDPDIDAPLRQLAYASRVKTNSDGSRIVTSAVQSD